MKLPLLAFVLTATAALALAQGPSPGDKAKKSKDAPTSAAPNLVDYVLSFGKKQPGQVSKEELTDRRLHTLFDLADANKDGIVTRDEITAYATRLAAEEQAGKGKGGKGAKGM